MTTSSKNTKPNKSDSTKKLKLDWNQCQQCKLVILKSNNEDHAENVCSNTHGVLESLDQPFLFQNYANLSLTEHKDFSLKKEYLFDYAFIHPTTMKLVNLKLGDLILVKYQADLCFPAVCWPLSQLEKWQVALSKPMLSLHGLQVRAENDVNVKVFKLDKSTCEKADKVILSIVNAANCLFNKTDSENNNDDEDSAENSESSLVLGFLKEMYLNKHVFENQQVFVVYMGKTLIFQIENVCKSSSGKRKKRNKECDVSAIAEKLNNSSLNEPLIQTGKENFTDKIEAINLDEHYEAKLTSGLFQITSKTRFELEAEKSQEQDKTSDEKTPQSVLFKDLAGLDKEIELLKEIFYNPLEFSDLYESIGLKSAKGILLFGPSGCGKTSLARAVCNEFKYAFVELKVAEIYSRNFSETETKLKAIFKAACAQAPSILFVDDIDNFCSRKESMGQDMERKVLTLFTSLIDVAKTKNVSLLCTTNKVDAIDLSLRRPGRLDKEIEISIPNQTARYQILSKKLKCMKTKMTDCEMLEVAQNCHGYVGSDLELLAQEAGLCCLKRLMASKKGTQESAKNCSDSINLADLFEALHTIKPSAMKEITFDIPKVYWDQIGGQHDLKKKLQQAIIWPIKHADSFKRLNIRAPRGLLMYGPPGCSKTMIAKALATETGLNFIAVKGPELFSKWVGESERMVRDVFRKARNAAPSIIFFDEIDAVAMERGSGSNKGNNVGDRVLAQLLNEMDGVENLVDVTVVAATNRPDMIDKALMRPGRLDRIVYVKLPDEEARREIFELKFKQIPVDKDIDVQMLVEKTKRYSGAEIAAVCNEAAFMALDGNMEATHIKMEHFELALSVVPPRTSDSTIEYFDSFSCSSGLHEI